VFASAEDFKASGTLGHIFISGKVSEEQWRDLTSGVDEI
jgi:hypothetical protein